MFKMIKDSLTEKYFESADVCSAHRNSLLRLIPLRTDSPGKFAMKLLALLLMLLLVLLSVQLCISAIR
jgi:hypothetical protein